MISGKMEKFRWPVFTRSFCWFSQYFREQSIKSEFDKSQKLNANANKTKIEKKETLRCYALQTLRKVNFTETVKRAVSMKKETYARGECCSFSSEHFNDEIFLQRNFSSSIFFVRWKMPTKRFCILVHIINRIGVNFTPNKKRREWRK